MANKRGLLIQLLWPVLVIILLVCCCCDESFCCLSLVQSIVSGLVVYWITVSVPEYNHSCRKIEYIQPRAKMIVQVGIMLLNNIQNKYSKQLPTERDIEQACGNLDLLKAPIIYPLFANEEPSWDLLVSKCITDLINPTQELIIICDKTDAALLDACSKIKEILYQLRFDIGVYMSTRNHLQDHISGVIIRDDIIKLVKLWRQIEQHA